MKKRIFNNIKKIFFKNLNYKYFIFYYKFFKNDFLYIKKIILWIFCFNKKKNKACLICESCLSILKNNHLDYNEFIYDGNYNIFLSEIEYKLNKIHISKYKVVLIIFKVYDEFILKYLINMLIKKNILYFFLINNELKIFNDIYTLFFYLDKKKIKISFFIIKFLYKFFELKKNSLEIIENIKNYNKKIILDSIYFFLFSLKTIHLNDGKKKLFEISKKFSKKKINFMLNFTFLYKNFIIKNDNINIYFFLNFFLNYML